MRSRVFRWSVSMLAAAIVAQANPAHAQPTLEAKLKAAILSKFPQFIEWPSAALAGRPSIDLCVAPPDPFGTDLQELVAGDTLEGRPVAVRHIDREQEVDGCQIVFVPSASPATTRRAFLLKTARMPILTVSDDQHFLDEGGIIRLRLVGGRMRFDINAAAAQQAGLRISSQLLQLALTVQGG